LADDPHQTPVFDGDLKLEGLADGEHCVVTFATAEGPVRVALKIDDLARLIMVCAVGLSRGPPKFEQGAKITALPAIAWQFAGAAMPDGSPAVGFSFRMDDAATLTFVTPTSEGPGQVAALQAALRMFDGVADRSSPN